MKAWVWNGVTLLTVGTVLAGGIVASLAAGEAPGEEKENASNARQLSAEEITEILKIRRALGGPVFSEPASSPAVPSVLSAGEPQAFHRALQAVKLSPPTPRGKESPPRRLSGTRPAHAPESELVVLRVASRRLDNTAADLEEIGCYATADRLRKIAASLRLEARSLVVSRRDFDATITTTGRAGGLRKAPKRGR